MGTQLIPSSVSLLCAAAAVLFMFLPCKATGQTKWMITVNATGASEMPTYSIASDPPNAPNCDPSGAKPGTNGDLYVCLHDKICWIAVTTPDGAGNMHSEMFIFVDDDILDKDDNTRTITHAFRAKNGAKICGPVDDWTGEEVDHKYGVVVFDRSTKRIYIDDPKIRIGTGTAVPALRYFQEACHSQSKFIADLDVKDESKKQAIINRFRDICEDVRKLKSLLK
jgi:hypothetical protein